MAKKTPKPAEKKYQFDVSKVIMEDLDGKSMTQLFENTFKKPLHKHLGNSLYVGVPDLDFIPKAKSIHKNAKVTFNQEESESFRKFIKEKTLYGGFIQDRILEQLIEV